MKASAQLRSWLRRTPIRPAYAALRQRFYLRFSSKGRERLFGGYFVRNAWENEESRSGPGSTLEETAAIRRELPAFIADKSIRSLLDVPCGDWAWMRTLDLGVEHYIGGDIVAPIIARLQAEHGRPDREFRRLDVVSDKIPKVDAIFCRDLLIHLPNAVAAQVLANFRNSGAQWLITTTYNEVDTNDDIHHGGFRQLNLTRRPFSLPPPVAYIAEGLGGQPELRGRCLGIWRLSDVTSL